MPILLSGSTLRRGGSGDFIDLAGAQPQLPDSETTLTGFTLVTDPVLRTQYRSSLGFIEFRTATMWSALPSGSIKILATGTTFLSTGTASGTLVVTGGVGIGGNLYVKEDIVVNGLTIGQGYQGINNIVIRGTATTQINSFENGQESIVIGYDALKGLTTSYKNIAIGRYALNSGTNISNTIAIGDSALKLIGTNNNPILSTITNITIISSSTISAATNAIPIVLTITSHGLNTGSQILISNAVGLSTATGGVSVLNNTPFWVNWLSNNSVALYTNKSRTIPANGFTATVGVSTIVTLNAYVGSGTVITPVIVTSPNHGITTGTQIYIDGIVGTTQLNQRSYFVDFITSSTLTLFSNSIVQAPINGTGYTAYSGSGTIFNYVTNDDNIAMGIDVASKLTNGSQNFFFGNTLATNLVTGSNNTIIGHSVANNITKGSGIIALGGDNLIDGVDNQVNIGSVFYYDGRGNTDINSDTRTGLGTDSTGTNSGALVVVGGLGIAGKVYSGGGGNPDEGYQLYTPIVTVTTTTPLTPKIGDIWIDPSVPAYLQYIKDGTSTFWIQVGAV